MKQLLLTVVLLLIAFPLYAQEDSTLETILVEETIIDPPLDYLSAFSTTINLEDFKGEYNSSSELLSFSPGVVVRDFGGFGQLKTLSIRGSSNDQVVILLDGIRINNSLGVGIDLSTIPLNYVEKFEIIRGGASALAGTDAIGGLVNIKTKNFKKPLTLASITYGSFDTISIDVSRAQLLNNFDYFISYNHSQSDGDFDFKSVNNLSLERINNEFKSHSLLVKLSYKYNEWRIGFLNEFFYDDKGVPGLGEFQENSSNQKDIRNLTSIKISKENFVREDLDFDLTVYHKFDQLKFEDPEPLLGLPVDTNSKLFTFSTNPKLNWYATKNQLITLGLEIRHETLDNDDFNDPERTNLSLFLNDEISLLDEKLIINPLTRLDLFWTNGTTDSFNTTLSPKLGILGYPYKNLVFKGNISYSNRVPNFSELFLPEQGFIGGNPDLNTEKSFDFDIGFSYLHPKFAFELNYFRTQIKDTILFVFISAQRIEPRNVGDVNQQGIEANLILKPFNFLDIFAGYTFLDGEIRDTNAQLPGRARNKFDFRAVGQYKNAAIFWESHFVDEISLTAFKNSRTTEPRTNHDLGGKIEWKKFFTTLEIKNLFDNKEVRDAFDFPLPGRTFFVTAGIKY